MNSLKKFIMIDLKYHGLIGFELERLIYKLYIAYKYRGGTKAGIDRIFYETYGRHMNWDNPEKLNEKIQWLKVNGFEDFHTIVADKYRMREYVKEKFGCDKYLIPVYFKTEDWKDITIDVIPDEPCVLKANHTQGDVWIIRDKNKIDIKKLRTDCRWALQRNLYDESREPQYRDIKPLLFIEKLLLGKDGHVPNDYKLHYINGELKFIYCSIGRETINKRNIYDAEWKPLMMTWSEKYYDASKLRGPEIEAPSTFPLMKELGAEIAKDFKYVRVDFYDVDGNLFFGEITLHHGSGFDVFVPEKYDKIFGDQLRLY